jgi:hypothetical protein
MSIEIKKRGRPRKIVEELVVTMSEKTPKSVLGAPTLKASKPLEAPPTTRSKRGAKSNGDEIIIKTTKRKSTAKTIAAESTASALKAETEDIPPPAVVARLVAIEESRVLEEISKARSKKAAIPKQENKPSIHKTSAEGVLPPLEQQSNTVAAHLQPSNTLAMGLPIPTYQSTMHTIGLQRSHCLPWLRNTPNLNRAAFLSTSTPLHATAKRKLPSLKEANKFLVTEQSSRGGPGTGAAKSRQQQMAEEVRGRPELIQPGEMPAKYKPAMRRVQAIIVALPIVIVTSWMLYERSKSFGSSAHPYAI